MKGFHFLVFAICAVAVTAQQQVEIIARCGMAEGVTPDMKDEIMRSISERGEPTKNFKCLIACMAEDLKIIEGNTVSAENLKNAFKGLLSISDDKVKIFADVLQDCTNKASATERCDRAWQIFKCARTNRKLMLNMAGMG